MLKIKYGFIKLFLLVLVICIANTPNVFAADDDVSVDERIAAVGFGKMFTSDPQKDITNLFGKLDSYNEKKDFKKIRDFYSDDFINNDGFDIDVYMKSVKSALDTYVNSQVKTTINSISVNDNYAVVNVTESGEAEITKAVNGIEGNGLVIASANVFYYLHKQGRKWKIVSANVMDETCSILYGSAKNVYFSLNVPQQVKSGSEYTASLSFAPMKDVMVSASITKEPIIFPLPIASGEIFKTVSGDGMLERIFSANTNNYNEYVISTIGISKPKMLTPTDFNLELSGTAFVLRRVNVFTPKSQKPVSKKNSKSSANEVSKEK
ncbi:MAG: hypothetical protein K6C94_05755 [Candidatus Gastranaerophilales bacterium]|nr:hypothetical protein [Candidatus Gastranaerophilales bacterium]